MVSVRGDEQDVLSRGFICPKAYGLKQLHEDPDRLRTPLIRRDGELREATWDEAFEEIDRRLTPLLAEHGRNAVAVYIGNPNAHNLSSLLYGPVWLRALGSQNIFSASTVDQMPKQVAAGLMFGHLLSVPVPGRRPHRPPADPGRQPARLERQPADGARHARPAARDPRARRQGRGRRPAPHPHRRGGRRAPLTSAPAPTRCCSPAMACTLVEEDLVDPGGWPSTSTGSSEVARAGARLHARARGAAPAASRPSEIRRMARELAAAPSAPPCTPASGPARRSSGRSPAGWSTCSTC